MTQNKEPTVYAARLRAIGSVLGPLLLASTAAVSALHSSSVHAGSIANEIRTFRVVTRPVVVRLSFIGTVTAGATVPVMAPFEGVVREKRVEMGEPVLAGNTLLIMDTGEVDMRFREAESSLLKAMINADNLSKWDMGPEVMRARRTLSAAETTLGNLQRHEQETKALLDRGIVPRMEYDGAVQQLDAQRLQVESAKQDLDAVLDRGNASNRRLADNELANAKARVESLRVQIQGAEVKAAVSGILTRPPALGGVGVETPRVEAGVRLSSGQILFMIADTRKLVVSAKVDEVDINRIRVNQPVEIDGDAFPGKPVPGRIISVSAEAAQSDNLGRNASFDIRAAILEADESRKMNIRIGMSARVTVEVYANPQALIVPHEAISNNGGVSYVRVYSPATGTEARAAVITGVSIENGVEIQSGLVPDSVVVLP